MQQFFCSFTVIIWRQEKEKLTVSEGHECSGFDL